MGMRRYGWLAEIKGATVDGYFQYEATGTGVVMACRGRRPSTWASTPTSERFGGGDVSRLLLLRHLHGELPARRRATGPSRAGSSATPSSA